MNAKTKNLALICLLVIEVVLISGCIGSETEIVTKATITTSTLTNNTVITVPTTKTTPIDLLICDKFINELGHLDENEKNYCRVHILKDTSICKDLPVRVYEDRKTEGVSFDKIECYTKIAIDKNDSSICDNIETSGDLRKICYALVETNPSYCNKMLELENKRNCYYELSAKIGYDVEPDNREYIILNMNNERNEYAIYDIREGEISICNLPEDISPGIREECIKKFAKMEADSQLCEELSTNDEKRRCYYAFSKEFPDSSVCDRIADLERQGRKADMSHFCYFDLAKNKSDSSLCEKIPPYDEWQGTPNREFCYAVVENNPDACYNLKGDTGTKTYCLSEIVHRTRDVSMCMDFEEEQKNICYNSIATLTNDISLCEKIDKIGYNVLYSACLLKFVDNKSDISLCDKMTYYPCKTMCYQRIAGYYDEYRYKHRPIG